MGGGDTPQQRDPVKDYSRGIDMYLDKLDELLAAEQGARATYDPERIRQQQGLEEEFDPNRKATRELMGENILKDLQSGYDIPDDLERELETDIRGAQTARGNYLGNGAVTAEAALKGRTAYDMYNRKLANAGTYLSTPSVSTPDRSAAYTVGGFSAGPMGVGFGQQTYNNALAANAQQTNPWATALGGAASGAAAGSAFGPYGAVVGGVVGGAAGYFASDERLKENITDTGLNHRGVRIVDFNFKGQIDRIRGVLANEVEKIMPELVLSLNGIKHVNYDKLGIKMRRVG
jgi:hypothetical protein